MTERRIHVVFGESTAGTLRQVLAKDGWRSPVVALTDDLSFGPICPPDLSGRTQWVEDNLDTSGWQEVIDRTGAFLSASLAPDANAIAWYSERDAMSYCGFLWWLGHLGERECEVIDITNVTFADLDGKEPAFVCSLGMLNAQQMVPLLRRADQLKPEARHRYVRLWQQLTDEDAAFRVIEESGLVSAPITYFDPLILSCTTADWQSMARVVGAALWQSMDVDYRQVGDLVLAARVRALIKTGALESRGDTSTMRCQVRLKNGGN